MSIASDGTIRSVQELLAAISASGLAERPTAHLRVWFRGQPDSSWVLHPGVYRPAFPEREEPKRLRIERLMNQDFRVQSAALTRGDKNDQELYFLQQHYGIPTRLLDWTTNPLSALFFAVAEKPEVEAALYMMDVYQLAVRQRVEKEFMGVATSRHPVFRKALQPICEWKEAPLPEFIIPVRPNHFDRRMMLQRSGFTFHVPNRPELTKNENDTLRKFLIPARQKELITAELARLGVDHYSIYGDLLNLARTLRIAYGVS